MIVDFPTPDEPTNATVSSFHGRIESTSRPAQLAFRQRVSVSRKTHDRLQGNMQEEGQHSIRLRWSISAGVGNTRRLEERGQTYSCA